MTSSGSLSKESWKKEDIIELIKLVGEYKKTNNSEKINNNEMFIQVANKLFNYGCSKTHIQCKSKWKELIEIYAVYKKSSNGDMPMFYSELDTVLGDSFSVNDSSLNTENKFGPAWTQYETSFLIKVMKVGNFINKLKTEEPLTVYEQIAQYMQKVGPISRTKEDVQQRWQNLKQSYIKYIKGDLLHFKYFDTMDDLLDWEPHSVAFEEDQFKDGHEYGDESYQNPDDYDYRNAPSVKRALNWTHKETESLLDVVQKFNIKQMKRDDVATMFDEASRQLRLQGFKRSSEQCKVKFKHLKVKYFGSLRRVVGGEEQPEKYFHHFERMRDIMNNVGLENFPDTDNENSEYSHEDGEHYEIEYLEDPDDGEPESFTQVFLREQNHSKFLSTTKHSNNRKGRAIWSQAETQYLLNLLKARNVKRYCRRPMFEEIALEMCKAGYKRSAQMCMIKWKNLRNSLYSCIRNMVEGKEELCPFYDEICEIVQKNGNVDVTLISDQDHQEYDESEDGQFEVEDTEKFQDQLDTLSLDTSKTPEIVCTKRDKSSEVSTEPSNKKIKYTDTASNTEAPDKNDGEMYVCNYKMNDIEHYCISLATTIKRLPQQKQAKLKIEIQKLLYSAEFDENF